MIYHGTALRIDGIDGHFCDVTKLESLDAVPGKIPNVPETLYSFLRRFKSIPFHRIINIYYYTPSTDAQF